MSKQFKKQWAEMNKNSGQMNGPQQPNPEFNVGDKVDCDDFRGQTFYVVSREYRGEMEGWVYRLKDIDSGEMEFGREGLMSKV